ncbi:MAG TPA: flagellar filament capping protein FliD [Rhodocyclaceae bacterium]
MDVNGIVSKLMMLERQPIDRIDTKTASINTQITAYGSLKSALATFQTSVQSLTDVSTYNATKATAADSTQFTVSSDATAGTGNYSVQVQKIAKSEKLQSAAFGKTSDSVGSGTLTFDFGTYSTDNSGNTSFAVNTSKKQINVTIPAGSDSLSAIASAINNAKGGISATVINDGTNSYLSFSPTDPGTANSLRITVSDADGNNADAAGLSRLAFDKSTGITSGSVGFAAPNAVTISAASNNNQFKLAVDGAAPVTLTIPDGTYDATNIVAAAQSVADAAFGAGKVTVALNGSNQLTVTSNSPSSAITAQAGNTGSTALFGVSYPAQPIAVAAASNNNQFDLTTDGGTFTVTLPDGSYNNGNIVAAMQTAVDGAVGAGNVTVSLNGGNQLVLTAAGGNTTATVGTTPGNTGDTTLFGVTYPPAGVAVSGGSNDQFKLSLDHGTAQTVTLAAGTYDQSNIVAAMQAAVDGTFGAGKATVSLNGSNQLVITSNTVASATVSAAPGNTGNTALFGVSLAAPNAVSIAPGNNQFNIAVDGGTATTVTVPTGSYDEANIVSTLQAAINSAVGSGKVTVSLNSAKQLVMASTSTSGLRSVTLSGVTNNTGLNTLFGSSGTAVSSSTRMTESVAAQDAKLIVDGVTVTKSSNTITDAIQGVTLNLLAESTTATTVTVKSDSTALSSALDTFVKNYNSVQALFKSDLAYDATTGTAGPLQSEGTVRSIQGQMNALIQTVAHGAGLSSLSELGISFQRDGTLKFNSAKLQTVLGDPTKNVKKFLLGSNGSGLAAKLDTALDSILNTGGILTTRTEGLNSDLSYYAKQKAGLETRMTAIEARYRKQYTNLDTLVASMNQTSTALTQQLASLPTIGSSSKSSG